MGIIQNEDIVCYKLDGEIVCPDCITKEEEKELTEDQIITEADSDVTTFCDRCKKQI